MTHDKSSSSPLAIPEITEYEIDPETGAVLIPLGGRLGAGRFALVDPGDVALVAPHRWTAMCPTRTWYARTAINGKCVLMHRLLLGLTDRWVFGDHINHNGLDNRRCNLRVVTPQQNLFHQRSTRNSKSKYKGVYPLSIHRWYASIFVDGKAHKLGTFDTEEAAARAYDAAALRMHGEYVYLNFPDSEGQVA